MTPPTSFQREPLKALYELLIEIDRDLTDALVRPRLSRTPIIAAQDKVRTGLDLLRPTLNGEPQ
jgi:hypothetical protein